MKLWSVLPEKWYLEAKIRLVENQAKAQREDFERKRRRVESSQQVLEKGSTATLSTDPFETPFGNPIGSRRPPSPIENVDCRRLVLGYKIDL